MGKATATKSQSLTSPDPGDASLSPRLEKAIAELRIVHELLLAGEGLDPRILTDFRDSLNRVRNTAWSAHQYLAGKTLGEDSTTVFSILSAERVRVTYQLCQALQEDLKDPEANFQTGQLIHLHTAVKKLAKQLVSIVGQQR